MRGVTFCVGHHRPGLPPQADEDRTRQVQQSFTSPPMHNQPAPLAKSQSLPRPLPKRRSTGTLAIPFRLRAIRHHDQSTAEAP